MNPLHKLNQIYISEHLYPVMNSIKDYALTSVIAPMGYGKSTAVNWFLDKEASQNDCQIFRINIYSDSTALFWRGFQASLEKADPDIMNYQYPQTTEEIILLAEHLSDFFVFSEKTTYLFLDDFHLLKDSLIIEFFCTLTDFISDKLHLIIASRNRFLSGNEVLHLGKKIHYINAEQLKLNTSDIFSYARRCDIRITKKQAEQLYQTSEGWFSVVYLNLRSFANRGSLLDKYDDIYTMITEALIEPLTSAEHTFLARLSLSEEFNGPMASYVTGLSDSDQILKRMSENNAFIIRLPDQKFRFHHMLQYCSSLLFQQFSPEEQNQCINIYGQYYEAQKDYIRALVFYAKAGNYDHLLRVIQKDVGVSLASISPENVFYVLEHCPENILRAWPISLLVLMRRLFTWQQIPMMMHLKELLLQEVNENPSFTDVQRGNLLGECDLIMSFLCYNDIAAMSKLHKSACRQMSGPAVSIRNYGSWTFGSPSVLMMFHRNAGKLDDEISVMNDSMPYYYQITSDHGKGAEMIMEAEAQYCRGDFYNSMVLLSRVRQEICGNTHINMDLCCDFLSARLNFFDEHPSPWISQAEKRARLILLGNTLFLNIFDSICAYYYALLGLPAMIPEVFREHRLDKNHYLNPAKPMMLLIENQVYLAQKSYTEVLRRNKELLGFSRHFPYVLCEIHVLIQAAGACYALQHHKEAVDYIKEALQLARADKLIVPFCENYIYIKDLLGSSPFEQEIHSLAKLFETNRNTFLNTHSRPAAALVLTDRELQFAQLIAGRLSNREIAATMYLSEGTVKQYMNRIYSKLHIEGDTRTKRQRLTELLKL